VPSAACEAGILAIVMAKNSKKTSPHLMMRAKAAASIVPYSVLVSGLTAARQYRDSILSNVLSNGHF
jgi:hypothetical protein